MLLRLDIKNKIKKQVEEGATFKNACLSAGVPIEMALNLTRTDDDFRDIYELAHQEHPVTRSDPAPSSVRYRDPHQIKHDFMEMLVDAGLYHKIAQMASLADPTTEEGQKVLMFMGRSILPIVTPKDLPPPEKTLDITEMSDSELKVMLHDMRQARLSTEGGENNG